MAYQVSIVTSVLNGMKTLRHCMESVAAQTYPCEHIVVDGGSTDGSQEIVRSSDSARLIEARGAGIARAFNIGIQQASGDLIGILNADDWLEADAIARSVQVLEQNPQAGFSYGAVLAHHPDYTVLMNPLPAEQFFDQCVVQLPFPHISSLVRRSVYDQCGLYDETFRIAMDMDLYARLIRRGIPGARVSGILGHIRGGGISTHLRARIRENVRLGARYIGLPRALAVAFRYGARSLAFDGLSRVPWGKRWLRERSSSRFIVIDPRDELT